MSDSKKPDIGTVRKSPERVAANPVIYCGPTLPRQYGLVQYRVFAGVAPGYVAQLVNDCPAVGQLIVPVAQLATTRKAILTKGSSQAALYQQIAAYFAPKPQPKATKPINKVVRR
jgi:hypothetical protein